MPRLWSEVRLVIYGAFCAALGAASVTFLLAKVVGGVPAGGLVPILTGTCATTLGSGWTESATMNGRVPRGTVAANVDVGATGGADTLPAQTITCTNPGDLSGIGAGGYCDNSPAPTITAPSNRQADIQVIWCSKD